jgi:hypothetical protein
MKQRPQPQLEELFLDLLEYRDKLLRSIGREESVQDRQELRQRIIESISDTTEILVGEVLERFLRVEFGLTADPIEPDQDDPD